jgi:hypothetical protein
MGGYSKSGSKVVKSVAGEGRRSATSILSIISRVKALS